MDLKVIIYLLLDLIICYSFSVTVAQLIHCKCKICHLLHIEAEVGVEISFAYAVTVQNVYYVLEPFGEICTNMGIGRHLHWVWPVGCIVLCAAVQCNTSKGPTAFFFASTHFWPADTSANLVIAAELSFSKRCGAFPCFSLC